MIRVLVVDPGERVGWCRANIWSKPPNGTLPHYRENDALPPPGPLPQIQVQAHGIAYLKDAALAVYNAVVVEDRVDVLIYETFILTHRGAKVMVGSDLQTAQFVGMCRLAAWLNPRVQLVPQRPKAMKDADKSMRGQASADDIQARLAKLPKSHDESHDGSALRHLWTYFFERYV